MTQIKSVGLRVRPKFHNFDFYRRKGPISLHGPDGDGHIRLGHIKSSLISFICHSYVNETSCTHSKE